MRALIAAGLALCVSLAHGSAQEPAQSMMEHACMKAATWYTLGERGPQPAAAEDVLRRASREAVVLLGERHDNASHHIWQLQTLAALHVLRPHLVLGFEAFPRRVQPALDEWVAGKLSVKQFLVRSEWQKVWTYPFELYRPLFQFARINRIPMVALNVDSKLTADVASRGWDAVPLDEKEGVSKPAPPSAAYEKTLRHIFDMHRAMGIDKPTAAAGKGAAPVTHEQAFGYFVESQLTWDRAMAEALAARTHAPGEAAPALVVGILGSGHATDGHGVPHQLRALGVHEVATLLPVDAGMDCSELQPGFADAVFAIAAAPAEPEPPPRLGIQLGTVHGDIEIVHIMPGSLAERTGLRAGDRIVAIAGKPATGMMQIVQAVRAQPPGTWLPIEVERGGQTLDLVVRFPSAP